MDGTSPPRACGSAPLLPPSSACALTSARKRFGVAVTNDAKATPIGVCVAVAADAKHATDTRGAALVAAANACFACAEATAACEAAGGVVDDARRARLVRDARY